MLDLSFSLVATQPIAADHGYLLYAALSKILPELHTVNGIAVHPISGRQTGNRQLALMPSSTLTVRVPDGEVAPWLSLTGKNLAIADSTLQVGCPIIRALIPACAVRSRLVVIKVSNAGAAQITADVFAAAARKQLDKLGISSQAALVIPVGAEGRPRRRTLCVKGREIVGYEAIVEGLSADESLTLQTHGLGGKHHMGCGVFAPLR